MKNSTQEEYFSNLFQSRFQLLPSFVLVGGEPKIIYTIKFDSFYLFLIFILPSSLEFRRFSPDSGALDNLLIPVSFRKLSGLRNRLHII